MTVSQIEPLCSWREGYWFAVTMRNVNTLDRNAGGKSNIFFDLPLKNYPPMSWTDIFPVLDDAMLDAYREGVTEDERKQFEEWFCLAEGITRWI